MCIIYKTGHGRAVHWQLPRLNSEQDNTSNAEESVRALNDQLGQGMDDCLNTM